MNYTRKPHPCVCRVDAISCNHCALFVSGVSNTTSFEQLERLASDLVDQVQTGGLEDSLNISIQSFAMSEPVPEPVDPTGGVRATNGTGLVIFTSLETLE